MGEEVTSPGAKGCQNRGKRAQDFSSYSIQQLGAGRNGRIPADKGYKALEKAGAGEGESAAQGLILLLC